MREKSMNGLADLRLIWSRFPCISLQVGAERQQVSGTPVLDVLPPDPDWDDTAALVAVLRCVVTVDTGTAHLAGAMGARTLRGAARAAEPALDDGHAAVAGPQPVVSERHALPPPRRHLGRCRRANCGGPGGVGQRAMAQARSVPQRAKIFERGIST